MDTKIDFVVSWVNSNDIEWQTRMNNQLKKMGKKQLMIGEERYHDYGFFKYWFRSVEKYAPWVNHIFLVTDQQKPDFFKENDRVTVVDHSEFIPSEYLPTFSSSVIELFLNKIPGLSEKFVYFNDDMLLNNFVKPSDFFTAEGLPKDAAVPSVLQPIGEFDYIPFNDILVLNRYFPKRKYFKKQWKKFMSLKYGLSNLLKVLLTVPFKNWSSFKIQHIPYALRKEDYDLLHNYAEEEILNTAKIHFRSDKDINIWLLLEIRFVLGLFEPRAIKIGGFYDLDHSEEAIEVIEKGKTSLICINDDSKLSNLEDKIDIATSIIKALEEKFPYKSSVEI
ncbi:sugar phosphotransferase [Pediococcus acidilactici]|uniref:Stealth CR1 domain-containing protein n=1 Tax=Pediococcus acidilactici TaxID=1254 RepID=UPI00194F6972|nr:Stealth CR1 domain-containing protein [Pediococcus acidilactici]MBM6585533.1 Stealth CR1 domain-containing protein [Pediococcus acidilactici]QZQ47089.1 sugar phosphotransferase [Pediococcus acidilactici]